MDREEIAGSYVMNEQACALVAEVQSTFCAGAWLAVIVLSMAVIDAQARDIECPGFKGNTKNLIDLIGGITELQNIRKHRNAIIHCDSDNPAITVDQQWLNRASLENEAKLAVRLMFDVLYMSPGT